MFLSHIQGAAERLQSMVDDLVVFSRAGHAELRSQVVDVQACATEARRALADTITKRLGTVEIATVPRAVGDPAAITTVLQHVVINALTFHRQATPSVQIAGRASSGSTIYTVTDNGIGVRPSDLESAFELFRRFNTREEYPGTGTGLALCRRLMDQQGGTIVLSSPPGGGSTVTLTLPTAPPPE